MNNLFAQKKDTILSAKESDPVKMGWMQGFPPPKDKILSAGDGSFFNFPAMRWSVVNMREHAVDGQYQHKPCDQCLCFFQSSDQPHDKKPCF